MKSKKTQMIRSNKLIVFFLFVAFSTSVYAQRLDKLFVDMPDEIIPTLTKNMKLELIEYYKINKVDTIKDLFQGNAYILNYDSVNMSIELKTTSNSTLAIKLLSTKAKLDSTSYVIGVIHSICAPICSSRICFYDKKWNKLKLNFVPPTVADWLINKDDERDGIKVAQIFKATFLEYKFAQDKNELIIQNHSDELLTVEDQLFVKPYFNNINITYQIKANLNEINIIR